MMTRERKIDMWRIPAMRKCAMLHTLQKIVTGIELDDTVRIDPNDAAILQGVATGHIQP